MWALVEIVRRQVPGARGLVYDRLEWNEFDHDSFRGAYEVVFDALGELGDREAQKTLVSTWKARPEGWISAPISRKLATLARRGLDRDVIDELIAWFESDDIEYHKLDDLKQVLKELGSGLVAASAVRRLQRPLPGPDLSNQQVYIDLAASIDDVGVASSFADHVEDSNLPMSVRRSFAYALANSRASVPLDVFLRLAEHPNDLIRAEALSALGRFAFRDVEQVIDRELRKLRSTHADGEGHPDRIQHAVVRALTAQGRLSIIVRETYRPRVLYRFAFYSIVRAMGQQNIVELVPLVRAFVPNVKDTRLLASIALALGEVGEIDEARALRDRILAGEREPYTESDLISGCHRLPSPEALEWLEMTWRASASPRESMHGFMEREYVEALGRIGTVGARTILMQRIEQATDSWDVLLDLHSISELATPELEEWLLGLLDGSSLPGRDARCWVISILGRVGTLRSAAVLLPLLKHPDPDIPQVAFRAIRDIRARGGEVWLGDEDLT
jgi:hypothetical protein